MIVSEIVFVRNPYNEKSPSGRDGAMVRGKWRNEYANALRNRGVTALYLNVSYGWEQTSYDFLEELPFLEELSIIAGKSTNLTSISTLARLQKLSLTLSTKERVNFDKLHCLTDAYIYFWHGAKSILKCSTLQNLHLDEAQSLEPGFLDSLSGLDRLVVSNSNLADVSEIIGLKKLKNLELVNCKKVVDFDPLRSLDLSWLSVKGCSQVKSLCFAKDMKSLGYINFSDVGNVSSLEPLREDLGLQAIAFAGSTNILDGDLSVLVDLPKLAMVMFALRSHYTHKLVKRWNWDNFDHPDTLLISNNRKRGQSAF